MNVRFILTFILKSGKYNFLKNCFFYLRFQRVHQPHPAHRVTSFQFLGNARRLHHPGQHGVHPFPCTFIEEVANLFLKSLVFHPWCVSCDSHKAQAQAKKKGGNDNENRKNYSETEGRGSGLPYGKR